MLEKTCDDASTVSIIITAYNAERFVQGFSENLLRTEGIANVLEIVVVDDGSSDQTCVALEATLQRLPNFSLFRLHENVGVACARNYALNHVSGDYIWFLDIDDLWKPTFLTVMVDTAKREAADIVVCRANRITLQTGSNIHLDGMDQHAVLDREQATREILHGNIKGYLWNKLFRRSVLDANPFPAVASQSDFGGTISALGRSERIVCIPDILYFHYTQASSITTRPDFDLEGLRSGLKSVERLLEENRDWHLTRDHQYFAVWFCIIPMAYTPIRLGGTEARQRQYVDEARRLADGYMSTSIIRFSISAFLRLALLKSSANAFRIVHLFGNRLRRRVGMILRSEKRHVEVQP